MKIFSIGCSFTEGQGLKLQAKECYTAKLAEKLNLEFYNFGAAGASNDYIFRKAFELINTNVITKNDIIIIQWTHFFRKELSIVYKKRDWYYYLPNSFHAYQDKVIVEMGPNTKSVNSKYILEETADDSLILEKNNKSFLEKYSLDFLNQYYQKNTTKNYINSLYTYLEYFGYKHIHFFGWDKCVIDSLSDNYSNFFKETFGGYTQTKDNHHPNKNGHEIWAEFLYEKIKELQYNIDDLEFRLKTYKNNLYRLKMQIENDIQYANDKLLKENQNQIEIEIENIRKQKQIELENKIREDELELNILRQKIKKEIEAEKENIKFIKKEKTII